MQALWRSESVFQDIPVLSQERQGGRGPEYCQHRFPYKRRVTWM